MIQVYNGSSWEYKPVKYYTGSAWEQQVLWRYDGSDWVLAAPFAEYVKSLSPTQYYPMDSVGASDVLEDAMGNLDLSKVSCGTPPSPAFEVQTSGGPIENGAYIELHGDRTIYRNQSDGVYWSASLNSSTEITDAADQTVMAFVNSDAFSSGSFGRTSFVAGFSGIAGNFASLWWDRYNVGGPQDVKCRAGIAGGNWYDQDLHDSGPTYMSTSTWYMWIATLTDDGTGDVDINAYRDGTLIGTTSTGEPLSTWEGTTTPTFDVGGMPLGASSGNGSSLWNGGLAHIARWDRALDSDEIALLAKAAGY